MGPINVLNIYFEVSAMDTGNKPDLLSVLDLLEFRPALGFLGFPGHLQDPLGLGLLCHPKIKLTHHVNLAIFGYNFLCQMMNGFLLWPQWCHQLLEFHQLQPNPNLRRKSLRMLCINVTNRLHCVSYTNISYLWTSISSGSGCSWQTNRSSTTFGSLGTWGASFSWCTLEKNK